MSAKKWRRQVSDPLLYATALLGIRMAGCGSDRTLRALARVAGNMLWTCYGQGRRMVAANVALAFPDKSEGQLQTLARQSVVNMIWNALEFMRAMRRPEPLAETVEMTEGLKEHFLDRTTGSLLVLPHLGSWEILGLALGAIGTQGCAVAHRLRNPYLDRLVTDARTATGLDIIPSKGAVRGILKACRRKQHVGVLIDQNTRLKEGGTFATFFGLPVTVTKAPAMLARKFHIPVVTGTCIRVKDHFRAEITPLPKPAPEYDSDEHLAQAMVDNLEMLIRKYPEQYVWMYKRWRYIPADAPAEVAEQYPFYARVYEEGAGQWTKS